jgi:Carboxypeptidase regulatory-like domain/TonB dependent receptor-like, beta-barrel
MRSKVVLGLCFFFFAAIVSAQTISTSQIRGTVVDASGAPVPGAQITLTQTATGAVRTATSGTDGIYSLPELPVGPYQLVVSKEGFSKYVQNGIVLQVGVNPTVDVSLKVGSVTQEVTVQAAAQMVEVQNTGVGEVVAPQQVQDLPLNGRQLTDLLYLSGGVQQGRTFRASYPSVTSPSIAGGAQGSVAYWLDGGTHNDPLSNQNLPLPFPDTIEEFKVETSSLPAQYGTHPSGTVNVVTKSGTNSFHGDAFEYLRNYALDSYNTSFAAAATGGAFKDPLKRNQFGGTLGGPVKRDKLFFFAGWQETIQHSSYPASPVFLPTAAMLKGDFTTYAADCDPGLASFPLQGPFVGNVTNPSNYSPVIKTLETHMPVPTNPCGVYNYAYPASFTENQGLGKIDYHQSDKNSIFARYFITNLVAPPGSPNLPASQGGLLIAAIDGQFDRVQSLTLGDTYVINSNMVDSVHATGSRSYNLTNQNSTLNLPGLFAEANILPADIGNIYQLGTSAAPKFPTYMPNFQTGVGLFGLFNSTPSLQPYDTLEFSNDLSLTHGAHQLSFGVDFINLRAFATNYLLNQGSFTFDGSRTEDPLAPPNAVQAVSLADYLLGWTNNAAGFSQDAPIPSIQHQNIFSLYAQDAWKLNRNLTVTAGLRWDPFFGHTDPKGHVVTISLPDLFANVHSTKFPTAPAGYLFSGDPGGPVGDKLTKNALDKWSPRIGVAWDPKGDGRMSIRAGFGIFYDFPNFSYDQFGFEEPYGGAVNNPAYGCTTTCITDPWGTLAGSPNPFTFTDQQGVTHAGEDPFPQFVGTGPQKAAYIQGALVFSYPQNIKPTYVMQYNLSFEKQVGNSWLLSVSYLGNQQRHLWGNNEANPGMQGPAGSCAYPLPAGASCLAGPCPGFLPPFVCSTLPSPIPANPGFFTLNENRLFSQFNAPAAGGVGPQGGPLYGETLLLEEGGTGNYNGVIFSAQHRFANHFTSTTNYTWSHCISDNYTTTLGFFLAAESVPYDRRADRGSCPDADVRNVFNESLVAETPKFSNHAEQIALGNWRFSVSAIVQSGNVLSDDSGAPINLLDFSGTGNGLTQRPDLIPGANPYCQPKGRTCWLNPKSFAPAGAYTLGNLPYDSLFGPGSIVVNTALSRLFQVTEGQQVEFRWEVFNFPNHANLYPPTGGVILPTFGQPTPISLSGLGALAQTVNDPRVMQVALKYTF